jgi:hypothetical protein
VAGVPSVPTGGVPSSGVPTGGVPTPAPVGTIVTASAAAAPAALRAPSRSTPGRLKVKPDSLLASRAKDEYVYVREDLRRIVIVDGGLLIALIVLWLFFTIVDPFGIY